MARQSTSTDNRPAAIAAVLNRSNQWVSARRKIDGQPFYIIAGHTGGQVYYTTAENCTCFSAQHRSTKCKHSAAVAQHLERQTAPKPAPKLRGYHELFGPDQD